MKRALFITLIAVGLICLAAVGWIARLVSKPDPHELAQDARSSRRRRARPTAGSAGFAR